MVRNRRTVIRASATESSYVLPPSSRELPLAKTSNPLELLLHRLELRVTLPEADREALLALPFKLRTLEPSTYLIREGDPPEHCAVLGSGYAYRQKLTGDGLRQIIALHIPGEAVDFQHLFLDVADHSVQMLTRGEVAFLSRKDLHALVRERPAIGNAILVDLLVEASIFREWVLNVGRRDARSRLAHVLCEFGIRLQAQGLATAGGFELPITQEQLADAVGLTPVHVNRTLKSLTAAGLITRSKRNIGIPDWERLRDVGDFNQRYLHLEPQESSRAT
jgi:CRP-like cAMP-binding protein